MLLLLLGILSATLLIWQWLRPHTNLPPGPPSTTKINPGQLGAIFRKFHEQYGPIMTCHVAGKPVVVLGSVKVARDLLEKRGNIYSGRPRNVMSHEILSGGMRGIGMSYGPQWKKWKRLLQAGLSHSITTSHHEILLEESALLLKDLLSEPGKYSDHLRRYAASNALSAAYGIRIKSLQDEIVLKNLRTEMYFVKLQAPGQYLVNKYPILLYFPKPLQWFRREAEHHRKLDTEMYLSYLNQIREEMKLGEAKKSMATYALEKQPDLEMTDVQIAYALSAPWAAGTGTLTFTLEVFLMAMLLHPSKQCLAQDEIDSIIGTDGERLPTFSDIEKMPYVRAVVKEVLRWRPVAPLAVPLTVQEDDVYESWTIPKGSTVYCNISAITQDPSVYPNPDEFHPERFLEADEEAESFTVPFGIGRRLCPGMHLALQELHIAIVRILYAFTLVPPISETTKAKEPILPNPNDPLPGSGFLWRPAPFQCVFQPRFERRRLEELLAATEL